ncbi:hypothetical protein SDC9_46932 [bioreactor metagenome]|uniref:Uncharacterized protein n=1 Tax=bioreactor metagenome TaxID=1076179 RepID=A0A644WAD5_9ZZZZ
MSCSSQEKALNIREIPDIKRFFLSGEGELFIGVYLLHNSAEEFRIRVDENIHQPPSSFQRHVEMNR